MRISAFLLECLVILMILAPCRDYRGFVRATQTGQTVSTATHQEGAADDNCSPLCTCSCCASVSPVTHPPTMTAIEPARVEKKVPFYIAPDYNTHRSAVWQPPRIS